jgi:hypothetical protein
MVHLQSRIEVKSPELDGCQDLFFNKPPPTVTGASLDTELLVTRLVSHKAHYGVGTHLFPILPLGGTQFFPAVRAGLRGTPVEPDSVVSFSQNSVTGCVIGVSEHYTHNWHSLLHDFRTDLSSGT